MPQNFDNIFSKWDGDGDGAVTFSELLFMLQGHRCAFDPFGVWILPSFSFILLLLLSRASG